MVQVSVTNKFFVEGVYANIIIFVVFIIISSRSSDGSSGGSKLEV